MKVSFKRNISLILTLMVLVSATNTKIMVMDVEDLQNIFSSGNNKNKSFNSKLRTLLESSSNVEAEVNADVNTNATNEVAAEADSTVQATNDAALATGTEAQVAVNETSDDVTSASTTGYNEAEVGATTAATSAFGDIESYNLDLMYNWTSLVSANSYPYFKVGYGTYNAAPNPWSGSLGDPEQRGYYKVGTGWQHFFS